MDLWKTLVVTMFASGLVVVASFHVEGDPNHQEWEDRADVDGCDFCNYYFQTGHGPYEVLWKLGSEIGPHISLKTQIFLLMDPGRLKVAEYFFNDYCHKFCEKREMEFRRENAVVSPCQREKENMDYE